MGEIATIDMDGKWGGGCCATFAVAKNGDSI